MLWPTCFGNSIPRLEAPLKLQRQARPGHQPRVPRTSPVGVSRTLKAGHQEAGGTSGGLESAAIIPHVLSSYAPGFQPKDARRVQSCSRGDSDGGDMGQSDHRSSDLGVGPPWRTALVTGASGGIGLAVARSLAAAGVEVVLAARRTDVLASETEKICNEGGRARALTLDVARTDEAVERIRTTDDEIGGLELIVANAGVGRPQPAHQLRWEEARDVFSTNFMGAMGTLTALLPRMVARKNGHLVGISSAAAYAPAPGGSAYCGTKSGLTAFLENLRIELHGTGVSVTTVHPGFVRTPGSEAFTVKPPIVLSSERAGDIIVRRLRRAPARIDFPFSVVMMVKILGALPAFIRDPMIRRMKF